MADIKIVMKCTCPACPVQYEGTISGVPFYFRARGNSWSIGVGEDPLEVSMGYKKGWGTDGDYFNSGWMDHDEAEKLIKACAKEYVERPDDTLDTR